MPKIKIDLIEGVSMSLFSTLYMKYIEAKKKNGVIFDQRSIDIVETILNLIQQKTISIV